MTEEELKESWGALNSMTVSEEARHMLRLILNDIRLRFELATPQTHFNADGSIHAGHSIRKATAFEMHQIYSSLLPDEQAMSYNPRITKQQ